jgi:molybdenum cofactor cytidylyltransferase
MVTVGDAFEAIILAAGTGSRFGGGKLLAAYGDGVLLDGALAVALGAPVRSVTLVTGADAERVAGAARDHAARAGQSERLNILHAADYSEGMGASLRTAAAALPTDTAGVFVLLGDMPRLPPGIFAPLIDAIRAGAPAAAATFRGQRGHPALIGAGLIPGLLTLRGDAGARAVLKDLGARLVLIEAPDDGVVFDIDERGDLIS